MRKHLIFAHHLNSSQKTINAAMSTARHPRQNQGSKLAVIQTGKGVHEEAQR